MMQKQKKVIIVDRCGQLANRLVLFANFAALAEEYSCSILNCSFHSYAESFKTTRKDIYCRYPASTEKSLWDSIPGAPRAIRGTRIFYQAIRAASKLQERWSLAGKSIVTIRAKALIYPVVSLEGQDIADAINGGNIIFANGWKFRAPNWVKRHAEPIRNYFQPIDEFDRAARFAVQNLRRVADVVIAIHLRQGDYRRWNKGQYFFSVERYTKWMHELAEQFDGTKVAFLVCSDERRSRDEFPGLTVGFGPGSSVGDLYAMALCDWILGPLSTFSQWASFYGETPLFHLRNESDQPDLSSFMVSYLGEVPGHPPLESG